MFFTSLLCQYKPLGSSSEFEFGSRSKVASTERASKAENSLFYVERLILSECRQISMTTAIDDNVLVLLFSTLVLEKPFIFHALMQPRK